MKYIFIIILLFYNFTLSIQNNINKINIPITFGEMNFNNDKNINKKVAPLEKYYIIYYANYIKKTPEFVLDSILTNYSNEFVILNNELDIKYSKKLPDILQTSLFQQFNLKQKIYIDNNVFVYIYYNIFKNNCISSIPSFVILKGEILKELLNEININNNIEKIIELIERLNYVYLSEIILTPTSNSDLLKKINPKVWKRLLFFAKNKSDSLLKKYNLPRIYSVKKYKDISYLINYPGVKVHSTNIFIESEFQISIPPIGNNAYVNYTNINYLHNTYFYLTKEFFNN